MYSCLRDPTIKTTLFSNDIFIVLRVPYLKKYKTEPLWDLSVSQENISQDRVQVSS